MQPRPRKPQVVIDAIGRYYERDNANIHRGVHFLSEHATEEYEGARKTVQWFLHAADASEIIFVRGATEAINLVAQTYGRTNVHAGDEVLITAMEHHSNIVPWQILCEEKGARLRVAPISDSGELLLEDFENLLGPRTKIVAVTHVSNALGTINPVQRIIEMAHRENIPVLVDGAQAVPHLRVDVQALDCDFYVFSGHKVYGPTGIGVLYGAPCACPRPAGRAARRSAARRWPGSSGSGCPPTAGWTARSDRAARQVAHGQVVGDELGADGDHPAADVHTHRGRDDLGAVGPG